MRILALPMKIYCKTDPDIGTKDGRPKFKVFKISKFTAKVEQTNTNKQIHD